MNKEHLQALIIDQQFGELPDEVSALLDAYLALAPEAKRDVEKLNGTLTAMEDAVQRHPETFRVAQEEPQQPAKRLAFFLPYLSKMQVTAAAAVILVAGLSGFLLRGALLSDPTNNNPTQAGPPAVVAEDSSLKPSPWARYRLESGKAPVLLSQSQ